MKRKKLLGTTKTEVLVCHRNMLNGVLFSCSTFKQVILKRFNTFYTTCIAERPNYPAGRIGKLELLLW